MKGQAAMEYLMTYGWAIIVVIAVVVALYAMGVFSLPGGGIAKCSPCFPAGSAVAYVDHNADNVIVRVGPTPICNVSLYVNGYHFTTTAPDTTTNKADTGTDITITATGNLTGDVPITVEYQDWNSRLYHNVTATLHGAGI